MLLAFALAASLQVAGPTSDATPAQPDAPQEAQAPATVGGRELDCENYHLELQAEEIDGANTRTRKLKLCGYKGSTKTTWLKTLRDVRMKVAAADEITAASKAKIDLELDAEIARVASEE